MTGVVEQADATQQRHRWLGFPVAVYRKFADDQAGNLAALLAYYGFFSLFPLLLVMVTILGYVLQGHPHLQDDVFSTALGMFPVIGSHSALHPLRGNLFALVSGLALALWSGLGVANQAQSAFNTVYSIPRKDWPGLLPRLGRSLVAVLVAGTGFVTSTALSGAVTGAGSYGFALGAGLRVAGALLAIGLDAALFTFLFTWLTADDQTWREAAPGAVLAAVGWYALQLTGTALVAHELKGAQSTYGTFATVIGLLFFFHLQAQLTLYAIEVNVVRTQRLWPRGLASFTNTPTTDADHRAYSSYAERQRFADPHTEQVTVTFGEQDGDGSGHTDG